MNQGAYTLGPPSRAGVSTGHVWLAGRFCKAALGDDCVCLSTQSVATRVTVWPGKGLQYVQRKFAHSGPRPPFFLFTFHTVLSGPPSSLLPKVLKRKSAYAVRRRGF